MNEKINFNNIESTDLFDIKFKFVDDEQIENYFKETLSINFEEWYEENKNKLDKNKAQMKEMVANGILQDDSPETIFEFLNKRDRESYENVFKVKNDIENNLEEIKLKIVACLEKYLSDWNHKNVNIDIAIYEDADYQVYGNEVNVDLVKLANNKDYIENFIQGVSHELVHVWFDKEGEKRSTEKRILEEGFAIFISGQSLEEFYEKKMGRDYDSYKEYSFQKFKEFIKKEGKKEDFKDGFKNMGYFYVIGYEIVKAIYKEEGEDGIKKALIDAKENPIEFILNYAKVF